MFGKVLDDTEKLIDKIDETHPVKIYKHIKMVYHLAMYYGYQFYTISANKTQLGEDIENAYARSDYNLLGGLIDVFVSKMLKDNPIPQVYPISFDNEDIQAARLSDIALEYWWKKENLSHFLYEVVRWAAITGTGIGKVFFNKDKGLRINVGEEWIGEGEVVAQVVNPFGFFPDPSARKLSEARWVAHCYVQPVEAVKKTFKEKAKSLKGEKNIEGYRNILSSYTGDYTDIRNDEAVFNEDMCVVREYWERGVEGHDAGFGEGKGRLLIRANGIELYDGENPKGEKLPFFVLAVKKPMDSFWGRGLVEPLVTAQMDLNRINSQIMENIDLMANIWIGVPIGGETNPELLAPFSAVKVPYDPDIGPPHGIPLTPIPAHVLHQRDSIIKHMMDIIGIHEVSMAQLPIRGSQMSGRALHELVEAEAVRHATEVNNLKVFVEEVARTYIEEAQEHYQTKRLASIIGQNRGVEIEEFIGADLRGRKDTPSFHNYDVEVGGGFGLSSASKAEQLLMLYDRKIIQDPNEVIRHLEFSTIRKFFYQSNMAENKANRHLKRILEEGIIPEISGYDNHRIHIKVF
ncbi:MAG: hypothetical protein ACFFDT_11485, partial [Candidatus Hodarchaeota archaeon]